MATTAAAVDIIRAWCDPAVSSNINAQACEEIVFWAEAASSGVAVVLPHYAAPERPATGQLLFMAGRPHSRTVLVGCQELQGVCAENPDPAGVCEAVMRACGQGLPAAIEIGP